MNGFTNTAMKKINAPIIRVPVFISKLTMIQHGGLYSLVSGLSATQFVANCLEFSDLILHEIANANLTPASADFEAGVSCGRKPTFHTWVIIPLYANFRYSLEVKATLEFHSYFYSTIC